jgi:PIN domain nuclease of toxin-antitoxin system
MRLLLDTCTLLWLLKGDPELSESARLACGDPNNELFIHQVSLLEMTLKHTLGKLPLAVSPAQLVKDALLDYSMTYVTLSDQDIQEMGGLPLHHRDPFDRLLIAHAKQHGLTLVSPDGEWPAYGVPILW